MTPRRAKGRESSKRHHQLRLDQLRLDAGSLGDLRTWLEESDDG
jgi:hypothetical protein